MPIIIFTGAHGSGTTTQAKRLSEKLGYDFFSTGNSREQQVIREHYASMDEFNSSDNPDKNASIDCITQSFLNSHYNHNLVIDSWVAWWLSYEAGLAPPDILSIYLFLDDKIRSDRVWNQKLADPECRRDEPRYGSPKLELERTLEKEDKFFQQLNNDPNRVFSDPMPDFRLPSIHHNTDYFQIFLDVSSMDKDQVYNALVADIKDWGMWPKMRGIAL